MWKKLQKETHPFVLFKGQDSEGATNLKDLKNIIIKSMPEQDGEPILRSHWETCRGIQHIRPRQISWSNTMIGSRTNVGILSDPHSWLEQYWFFSSEMLFFFACRKVNPWQSTGGVDRDTCRTPHFHMYSHSTDHTAQMTCVQKAQSSRLKAPGIFVCHQRVMVHPLLHATLSTSSPSLSSTSPVVLSSSSPNPDLLSTHPLIHCEDPRQDGTSTEYPSSTQGTPSTTVNARSRSWRTRSGVWRWEHSVLSCENMLYVTASRSKLSFPIALRVSSNAAHFVGRTVDVVVVLERQVPANHKSDSCCVSSSASPF